MPSISVERTILGTKKAVLGGLIGYNTERVGKQKYKRLAISLREIEAIEGEARRFGATRSYLDTMSFQAPGFYRACGYKEFGSIDGYPGGVTRHWFTKAL
jgi:hypothetical protein